MKVKCPLCKIEIELDKDNNKNERYIQCPNGKCLLMFLNKYYEDEA